MKFLPLLLSATLAGAAPLTIQSITKQGANAVIRWTGATNPVQVLTKTNFSQPWQNLGIPTTSLSITTAINKAISFFLISTTNSTITPTGTFVWSRYITGPLISDVLNPFSLQSDDNAVMAGAFSGSMNFGGAAGATFTSSGDYDAFISRYNGAGGFLWAKRVGGPAGDFAYSVAIDNSGSLLLAGGFSGTIDFGGGPLTSAGGSDIFVAKFTSSGTHVWSKQFGGTGSDKAFLVATDKDANVILSGWFGFGFAAGREVDFGGGPLTSAGDYDIFLAKFTATGTHIWSKRFGGTSAEKPESMAVSANGDVIMGGYFNNTADFGGGPLTSAGYADIVLARYSANNGAHLWSKRFGGNLSDSIAAVVVDSSGNVALTGLFGSSIDFGGGAFTKSGAADFYLAKLSSAGSHVWSKAFISGQTGRDLVKGLAVDTYGNIAMTGGILSAMSFGGAALTNPLGSGTVDSFLAKFNPSGTHLWSNRYGGYNDDWGAAVAVDTSGNVLMAGQFYGSMQFGQGEQQNTGGFDGFIGKFSP